MSEKRKQQIHDLLKAIETGEEAPTRVVNPDKYIQHNPMTAEGGPGLAVLFKRLAQTNPGVNIVRIFSDGDYVFGHTEYDFSQHRVGFEVFHFEGEHTTEHWDNIQSRKGPNHSGHSMVDGATEVTDIERTEQNRQRVGDFVEQVLIAGQFDLLPEFVAEDFTEHSPELADGIASLTGHLQGPEQEIDYRTLHRLLAEGNFVLAVCEGFKNAKHTSLYDLYRLDGGKIVEHWDTTETIPHESEWKNNNGKF